MLPTKVRLFGKRRSRIKTRYRVLIGHRPKSSVTPIFESVLPDVAPAQRVKVHDADYPPCFLSQLTLATTTAKSVLTHGNDRLTKTRKGSAYRQAPIIKP